jgi:chemotaxis-related protein WspD
MVAELQVARRPGADVEVYSCWSRIGVEGDRTCRELLRHVHCHNCPVYSAAAVQFLDRPVMPEYRREWTEHFACEKRIATPAKVSAVIFRLGPEWLAMPTQAFQEIAERRAAHSLPHRRSGVVLGIVNVRGELLICAALERLLGLESSTRQKRSRTMFKRLLVADWAAQRFAFPVEEVHGVYRFHEQDLREPPATVARSGFNCSSGVFPWRNFTVGFLDPDALFASLNRNLT